MIQARSQFTPKTARLKVDSPYGLHMRAAAMISRIAERYHSQLLIGYGPVRADARSLLALISLGIAGGSEIEASASGPDADAALTALESLFAGRFADAPAAACALAGKPQVRRKAAAV